MLKINRIENARLTIALEVTALQVMGTRLDKNFGHAIDIILQMQGRLVVLGMGKSGIIGQKIAATLASTGTPSFFIHPGEAFHGDLGMIKPVDVALLISNSGETEEIIQLLPFLQHQQNKMIALTGNDKSILAKHAEVVLDVGVEREACSNNLAPTSSTTCTLVMGDALAVALSVERNFQPEDFARFHPGGKLGKKLLTRVRDVMSKKLPVVKIGSSLHESILMMTTGRRGVALIEDESGEIIGIFTDGDLRRAMIDKNLDLSGNIEKYMTKNPIKIDANSRLNEAEMVLNENKIHCLVVVEGGNKVPSGIVDLFDVQI